MRVLIVGNQKCIISNLIQSLSQKDYQINVWGCDLWLERFHCHESIQLVEYDLQYLTPANYENFDIIFCAFNFMEWECHVDCYLEFIKIAQMALHRGGKIVFFSTTDVHDNHLLDPNAHYKRLCENWLETVVRDYTLEYVVLRPTTLYGGSTLYSGLSCRKNIVDSFLNDFKNFNTPIIKGDGSNTRDFLHMEDFIEKSIHIVENPSLYSRAVDIGTGHQVSVLEVAKKIHGVVRFDYLSKIYKWKDYELKPVDWGFKHNLDDYIKSKISSCR